MRVHWLDTGDCHVLLRARLAAGRMSAVPAFAGSLIDGLFGELAEKYAGAPELIEWLALNDVRWHLERLADFRLADERLADDASGGAAADSEARSIEDWGGKEARFAERVHERARMHDFVPVFIFGSGEAYSAQ